MRNGQNKRMRGRNRKSHNPLTRVYESNGPDVKIRGTANHVAEKYIQLARDAQASGDPVAAENYYQHAEHYFRLIAAAQEQFRQSQPFYRPEGAEQAHQPHQARGAEENFDESDDDSGQPRGGEPHSPREGQRSYQQRDHQPYQREHQHHNQPQHQQHQPHQQHQQQHTQQPHYQQNQPQPYQGNRPQQGGSEGGDVDRLPSFITGGQPQPQSHGQNGYDNQGDRFSMHRRRRRGHRGPRPDHIPDGAQGLSGGEGAEDRTPPVEPVND